MSPHLFRRRSVPDETSRPRVAIRPAVRADAPLVLSFIRGLAEYERLLHECVATLADVERTLFGERPEAEVVIASLGTEPVGFALFFPTYSTFLAKAGMHLEDLFVVPEARGHGVGQALLAHLASLSVERGYGRLEWAVLDWNEPSIRFYEHLGARPLSDWITYRLTGDALVKLAGSRAS